MNRRLVKLALLPAALLVCTPLYAQADPGSPPPPTSKVAKPLWQADRDYYANNVASQVESPTSPDQQLDAKGQVKAKKSEAGQAKEVGHSTTTGFPPAAKELGKREALATTKGISPRETASKAGQRKVQRAKLLTLLVEFNPNANDDFSGFERPDPGAPATASPSRRTRC